MKGPFGVKNQDTTTICVYICTYFDVYLLYIYIWVIKWLCRSKGGSILGTTGRVASQGYYCTHWGSMNKLLYLPIREGLEAFYGICIGKYTSSSHGSYGLC